MHPGDVGAVIVQEIDFADDVAMSGVASFESSMDPTRERTIEALRSMLAWAPAAAIFAAVERDQLVATIRCNRSPVDGLADLHVVPSGTASDEVWHKLLGRALNHEVARDARGVMIVMNERATTDGAVWDRLGFREHHRRLMFRRQVQAGTLPSIPVVAGVQVCALGDRSDLITAAHAVWSAAELDVVNAGVVEPQGFDSWLDELTDGTGNLPPSLLVALDGAEDVAGVAYLHRHAAPAGQGGHRFTGVAREWRGKGIGRLLKVHLLHWAAANGIDSIRTSNHVGNESIIRLNRSLGYEQCGSVRAVHRSNDQPTEPVSS